MIDKYSKIEKILLNQGKFYISLELDRIKTILALLDNPQDKIKVIHVAGTNGKGSVCAVLNEILIQNGCKAGCYTSPHLVKYNERIKINNQNISDEDFYEIVVKITKIAEQNSIHLTEFEILTVTMFEYFYKNRVDFAIVEVGLGGRFDATNCIEKPLVSVITSISKDHTERLGDTIEKISFEKAGIIKKDAPVIFDANNLGKDVFIKVAKEKGSPFFCSNACEIVFENEKNILMYGKNQYDFNLLGKYQNKNVSLALKTLEVLKDDIKISEKAIEDGLKKVKWNGRFDYIKEKNLLLDGCHNPDGAKVLRESLDFYFKDEKKIFVYTSLKNKDFKQVQKNLFADEDIVYHLQTEENNFINEKDIEKSTGSLDIIKLKKLIEDKKRKELLIICGSLYALGNVLGKINLCS